MRIDVVSIFPAYLEPLGLSLPGKAQRTGVLDLRVHDLRGWAHDRHRTVDDTPYGGGAGMVMRPEPWGEALDELVSDGAATLVVPSPAGQPLTQRLAARLAAQSRLVVACGRYEGIDQRVLDHAALRMPVCEVSVGDYVLNGGEAAALVLVEAVVRLLPGFLGNPESLREESHGDQGLLEYPVYTKPASWRGHDVPDVLLSGDHARIAAWRHEQSLRRTAARRPDLLPSSAALADVAVRAVSPGDAGELLTLQRAAYVTEGQIYDNASIPPLTQTLAELQAELAESIALKATLGCRMVGTARARLEDGTLHIGRIAIAPDMQGRGIGTALIERLEADHGSGAHTFALFTGDSNPANRRLYERLGYRETHAEVLDFGVRLVHLAKPAGTGDHPSE
jgi:tRNA (guanine37-N1)-methyltransferase